SLISTPLEGGEILPAKMIGSAWKYRFVALGLLVLWLIGLPVGAVHPIGVIASAIEMGGFLGFAAALGTFLSLKGKKTSRAQSTTIAILVALNGGLLCFGSCLMHSILPAFTCTPMIQALSLLSSENVGEMLNGSYVGRPDGEAVLTCILGVLV